MEMSGNLSRRQIQHVAGKGPDRKANPEMDSLLQHELYIIHLVSLVNDAHLPLSIKCKHVLVRLPYSVQSVSQTQPDARVHSPI
jgi:hypothetical protein